jgi:hypothetical protein
MPMDSIAQIIRVKKTHQTELTGVNTKLNVERSLQEQGFEIEESSEDGFIVTYGNTAFDDENRNTLVFVDNVGNVTDVRYTVKEPE